MVKEARPGPALRSRRASAALWLIVFAVVGVGLVAAYAVVPRPAPQPNIVLVVIDALRRDHVGAYGYPRPVTPFLDEVARRGVVFDNAWSHAPQTFNATAALLTGQVAPLLVRRNARPEELWTIYRLADQNSTLAEMLAEVGYDTLGVFTNPHHAPEATFAQGMRLSRYLPGTSKAHGHALAEEVNAAAKDLVAELDPSRPFFAYVHYMDVHNPYLPPEHLKRVFQTTWGRDFYRNGTFEEREPKPSLRDLRFMVDSYDACIRYVDDSLRELFPMFESVSRGRETIFIVTADHGDEFMEHGGLGHGHTVYQELLRVPLIVQGGRLPAGVRVASIARGIDVMPTLAELAGREAPPTSEGRSLLPLIAAAAASDESAAASGAAPGTKPSSERVYNFAWFSRLRSITDGNFHMPRNDPGVLELYDVRSDPLDQNNLAEAQPDVIRRMRFVLLGFERRLRKSREASSELHEDQPEVDPQTVEQLRALGYVE